MQFVLVFIQRVCLLSEDEYEKLKNGQTFIFDYSLAKKIFVGDKKCYEEERKYTCDDYLYKKDISAKKDSLSQFREEYKKITEEPIEPAFDADCGYNDEMLFSTNEKSGIKRR